MKITNKYGFPQALVDAVKNDPYDNGGAWRSVTQLIAPPRTVILKKRHDDEIEEDVSEMLYRLYGQIVHSILERANTKDLVEDRLFSYQRGQLISGGFDVLQLDQGRLIDWKFSTVWKAVGDCEDWVAQTNLLALLCKRQLGTDIRELEIALLMRDHHKARARREPNYPSLPAKRIPVTCWTSEQQEQYLDERVLLHLQAEKGPLPFCSAKERWAKPDIYAVMKHGKKTAVKGGVHSEREKAELMLKDNEQYYLEVRSGESTRCLDYCLAAPFCDQFEKEKLNGK